MENYDLPSPLGCPPVEPPHTYRRLLFFAGVLLAVGALDTAGVLRDYAERLVRLCGGSPALICTLLGVSSAVVDNVPLVQAPGGAVGGVGQLPRVLHDFGASGLARVGHLFGNFSGESMLGMAFRGS